MRGASIEPGGAAIVLFHGFLDRACDGLLLQVHACGQVPELREGEFFQEGVEQNRIGSDDDTLRARRQLVSPQASPGVLVRVTTQQA
jgi:hypothetical protein